MKAVVIGLGVMGQLHARVYNEMGILDGVSDVAHKAVYNLQNKYSVQGYITVDSILRDPPNIVSVAVPTLFHKDIVMKCLEAECHVLVEKPIALEASEAEEMIALAKEKQRILAVGYIERYNPAVSKLQELVEEGYFGEITSVNIKRVGGIPRSADNVIVDLMTHDFNILAAIFNQEPDKISAHQDSRNDIVDSAQVLMGFGTASATCESNWVSPIKVRRIEVTGTESYCVVDLIEQSVTQIKKDIKTKQWFEGEPLKRELATFVKAASFNTEEGIITGEDALRTLRITLAAQREGAKVWVRDLVNAQQS